MPRKKWVSGEPRRVQTNLSEELIQELEELSRKARRSREGHASILLEEAIKRELKAAKK